MRERQREAEVCLWQTTERSKRNEVFQGELIKSTLLLHRCSVLQICFYFTVFTLGTPGNIYICFVFIVGEPSD
jgi:hypothetical protein